MRPSLLRAAAFPAPVPHPGAGRVQRQPVQERPRRAHRGARRPRRRGARRRSPAGIFILPYVIFSSLAGQLADRFEKAAADPHQQSSPRSRIMLAGAAGTLAGSLPLLLVVLGALGVQATFFSPLKYGILPEHLRQRRADARQRADRGGHLRRHPARHHRRRHADRPARRAAPRGRRPCVAVSLPRHAGRARDPARAAGRAGLALRHEPRRRNPGLAARRPPQCHGSGPAFLAYPGSGRSARPSWPSSRSSPRSSSTAATRSSRCCWPPSSLGVGAGSLLASRLNQGAVSARFVPAAAVLLSLFTFGFALLAALPAASDWVSPAAMLLSPAGPGRLRSACSAPRPAAACSRCRSTP